MINNQSKKHTDNNSDTLVKTELFGVTITNEEQQKILEYVIDSLEKKEKNYFIVTPNPEIVVYASKHEEFKHILNSAEIALCDGMQLYRAANFLRRPLQERISGVNFMEELCKYIARKPITVGFLGGRGGVAELAAQCLIEKYPGLKVSFVGENWPEKRKGLSVKGKEDDNSQILNASRYTLDAKLDILFVAFGFPKQEQWMYEHIDKFGIKVMMGVGGAFDYISGRVPRASKFVQAIGFEWLYRLIRQPWRWKRQLSLIEFVWLVIKEKFK